MSLSLIQLLSAVGDENIKVQYIDECTSQYNYTAKSGNKLTVHTDEEFDSRGMQRFGFVLWIDRAKLATARRESIAAIAAAKGEQQ